MWFILACFCHAGCKGGLAEGALLIIALCSAVNRTLHTENWVTGEACFSRSKEALQCVLRLSGYMFETGRIFKETKEKRKGG